MPITIVEGQGADRLAIKADCGQDILISYFGEERLVVGDFLFGGRVGHEALDDGRMP